MKCFGVFVFLLLASGLCSCTKTNKHIRIPLLHQKSPREHMLNAPNLEHHGIFTKWLGEGKNDTLALKRFLDSEFYGQVVVGSPGKTFNVAFDTTWSYSWLMSSQCDTDVVGCWFHHKYNNKDSSTYQKDGRKFNMNVGTYNLTGFFSNDTFSIGHSRANNQSFIEMTGLSYAFVFTKADGVMGLGLKYGDYNPFIYQLLQNGSISKALFSIYMSRDRQSNRGGDIYLGAIEPRHVYNKNLSAITYLPVTSYAFWQFDIDRVYLESSKKVVDLCTGNCTGIADSSNNAIVGPKDVVLEINKIIQARKIPFFGRYYVDCDTVMKLPKITFVLQGQPFTLNGKQYTQKMSYAGLTFCISAFTYSDDPSEQHAWILGATFLSPFYSIYDIENKKIGFVRAAGQ